MFEMSIAWALEVWVQSHLLEYETEKDFSHFVNCIKTQTK